MARDEHERRSARALQHLDRRAFDALVVGCVEVDAPPQHPLECGGEQAGAHHPPLIALDQPGEAVRRTAEAHRLEVRRARLHLGPFGPRQGPAGPIAGVHPLGELVVHRGQRQEMLLQAEVLVGHAGVPSSGSAVGR